MHVNKKLKRALKIAAGVIVVGGIIYIIDDKNEIIRKLTVDNETLNNRVTILEEVVSEEVLETAISTTTKKLDYRLNKIEVYKLKEGPEAKAKLEEHMLFRDIFTKRLKDFNELKRLRYLD